MSKGLAALGVLLLIVSPASAAYIHVYGSPTYTPGAGGFRGVEMTNKGVNSAGTAVGYADKYASGGYSSGKRAVRWDASGVATELGNLGTYFGLGTTYAYANAINSAGTAVGYADKYDPSDDNNGPRAVRWDASGTDATELGNLGTSSSGFTRAYATAINSAGTAVGFADKYDGPTVGSKGIRPVRWDASGTDATELGHLGTRLDGNAYGEAHAINDSGTAVGFVTKYDASGSDQGSRAVRWDASGTAATELENLGTSAYGSTDAYAIAINSTGTAAGYARKYDSTGRSLGERAVRWDASGTAATELGTLNGGTFARATAINSVGTVAGYAFGAKGRRAVRWDATGTTATELGNLGTSGTGLTDTYAFAINSADTAVGYAEAYDSLGTYLGRRAAYWGTNGLAVDLNTLIDPASGWMLYQAAAISDTGWIAGLGTFDPDGPGGQEAYTRLFSMLVPATVPEPSALSLLALGAVALLHRRRNR